MLIYPAASTLYEMCYFTDETLLLDLKHLLMEAKQTVPDFLRVLESDSKQFEDHGCKCHILYIYI